MTRLKKDIGSLGEKNAVRYLQRIGYRIIETNVFIGGGEIDIVAQKGSLIVFVEVKTRENDSFIDLYDAIGVEKAENLEASCDEYLAFHHMDDYDFRIDLIGVVLHNGKVKKFTHLPGVI